MICLKSYRVKSVTNINVEHIMKSLKSLLLLSAVVLFGCTSKPEGVEPVQNFELTPYLGKWYEIARLDHSFERGLSNVTAEYKLREDGGVTVINRGYSQQEQSWKQAEGKAYFVDEPSTGKFKSFFLWPILFVVYHL